MLMNIDIIIIKTFATYDNKFMGSKKHNYYDIVRLSQCKFFITVWRSKNE